MNTKYESEPVRDKAEDGPEATYGSELRRFRQEKELKLKEAAQSIGCSVPYLSEVERGERPPFSVEKLRNALSCYGKSTEWDRMTFLAIVENPKVQMEISDKSSRKMMVALYRLLADLDDQEIESIQEIIKRHSESDC